MKKQVSLNRGKGFTLIELLVVIALIGMLASVVLASLNSSRAKGVNAAIRNNLTHARAQVALFYDDGNLTYEITDGINSVCVNSITSTPKGIAGFITETDAINGAGQVDCNDSPTRWALAAQFTGDQSDRYFCIDSTGFANIIVGVVGGAGASDFGPTDLSCE